MKNLNEYVSIYQNHLKKGDILIAYNELVKFVMGLRTDFIKRHSDLYSFAGILHGYLDFTYFYFSNDFLKRKKLKFALVLNHVEMRFEIWLLGNTSTIQKNYWELLKDTKWNEEKSEMPDYSVLEMTLINHPDFDNLNELSRQIESKLLQVSDQLVEYLKSLD